MPQLAFVSIQRAMLLALLFWLAVLAPQNVLNAQVPDPEISRLKNCLPPKPPRAPLEEQTLCEQFPNLTPSTANKVIGIDQSSISYSANEKDPLGPIGTLGWSGQTLIINGTLIVNDPTWFLDCTVKMGPGARIVVEQNQAIFAWFSRFFACAQMWEGIRLDPNSSGSFGYCHIQDANNAIHSTFQTPIMAFSNRFNRNNVGIRSSHASTIAGTSIPTVLNTTFFFDNEFTMSSPLNSPYPGQVFVTNWPTGIYLRRSTASIPGLAGSPNRFSRLAFGIYAFQRNESVLVGNATFEDLDAEGIYVYSGSLTINASAPCTFRDNYVAGIEVERGLGLNVAGCNFDANDSQFYGILSDARWSDIQLNTFEQHAEHLVAIYCIRQSGTMSISQNTIDIASLSDGIVVETPIGTSAQGLCSIEQNAITISEIPASTHDNIGIHVIGGSGDNFTISYNNVNVYVLGLAGPDYYTRGIFFEQCVGLDHTVSGNEINTTALGSGMSATRGILIRSVQNGVYCLNNVDYSTEGITFFGNNAPARIERNHFDHHNFGLVVDGDAGFAPAVVGPQIRAANAWDPLGYKLLAAVCTGNTDFSPFFIHNPNFLYFPPPPFVNPSDWFKPDFGDPNPFNECVRRPDAPELFETKIADGSYFDANSTALLHWELKRNLYYKMLRNPAYGSGNPAFAAFFAANVNTNAGKFAKVERDLYLASGFSSTLVNDFQALEAQRSAALTQLAQLEAALQPPAQLTGANSPLATAKLALLDALSAIGEQQSVLLDQHAATSTVQLTAIRAYNAAITTTHVFEENQKALNEIGIKMALGEPFLQSDLTAIEAIADQLEANAGTTQWWAESMLPCRMEDATANRSKRYDMVGVRSTSVEGKAFSFLPNPATDRVEVRFQETFSGIITLMDTNGRILIRKAVTASTNEPVLIQVSHLANGLYYLEAIGEQNIPSVQKVVIKH